MTEFNTKLADIRAIQARSYSQLETLLEGYGLTKYKSNLIIRAHLTLKENS